MNLKKTLLKSNLYSPEYHDRFKPVGISIDEYYDYTEYGHLRNDSKFETSRIFGTNIRRVGTYSFVQNVEEILIDEIYKFDTDNPTPRIIDCGANIGLSIIFFKRLYPNSEIIAFEPDEAIFAVCRENLKAFGFTDVKLINAAVWKGDCELSFLPDNSLGGAIVENEASVLSNGLKKINAERLSKYLDEKIDFLKIDIEGAELEVIEDCKDKLDNIETLFVEYHSRKSELQELDKLLYIMSKAGFRYYIKHAWDYMKHPFVEVKNNSNNMYDLQLNIFAYRA